MMRIFHSSGSILTGSDLASALLNYSRALANRRQTDVVDIPILNEDGTPSHAQVLIGYCSPLVGVSSESSSTPRKSTFCTAVQPIIQSAAPTQCRRRICRLSMS